MINYRRLQNTLSFDETIHQLTDVLTKTRRSSSLALLEKALAVAEVNPEYRDKLGDALLKGSTRECRDVFERFGEYWQTYQEGFPPFPHRDAVNGIDSTMHAIKLELVCPGAIQEAIEFS